MIRCREAARLVLKAVDTRLSLKERVGLRVHLRLCGACASYARWMGALRKLLRRQADFSQAAGSAVRALRPEERKALIRALTHGRWALAGRPKE